MEEATIMTAQVTRGDLIISVSGTGVLSSATERELGFETESGEEVAGYLDEVLVEVGDHVQEGDLLARLETDDLELEVAEAEISLREAQLNLDNATEEATEAELADARAAVESAKASLTTAQYNYESAQNSSLDADVRATQIKYQYAVDQYWEAEKNGAKQSTLEKKWDERASTEYDFNQAVHEAQMEQLNTWNQVDQAQNRVLQMEEALASLESGPDEETVLRAELNLARAELALEEARDDLEAAELRAPFDGTVVDVAAMAGERVGADGLITLADLDHPQVKFWVEESDMEGVVGSTSSPQAMGNRMEIEFEGLPDEIITGTVTRIDPALVTVNGTLAVQAWASLDLSSRPRALLGEMNADVEVISAEARDVVLAPVQALREISEGQYAVFVMGADGELAMRPVEVGLKDLVNAEIISGLEAGETISLGEQGSAASGTLEQDEEMPGPPGGMIPGGGMFGGGGGRP
jgi:HlyD family secretion protein